MATQKQLNTFHAAGLDGRKKKLNPPPEATFQNFLNIGMAWGHP